jgi:hypothetical protein
MPYVWNIVNISHLWGGSVRAIWRGAGLNPFLALRLVLSPVPGRRLGQLIVGAVGARMQRIGSLGHAESHIVVDRYPGACLLTLLTGNDGGNDAVSR